ncbi:MAG: beta-galactosidase [Kiritimatiellaeota bacterium]|nr:beta-galactosidase [Kiritimatiellota bacterium]
MKLLLPPQLTLRAIETRTFAPREDTEVVLHNPDMGWVLYENFALDPRPHGAGTLNVLPQAQFAGCDYVAVMFAWSDVEKAEGQFDWSRVDQAWDHWQQRGKEIHLRLSTEPLFGWSRANPPGGLGIPDWLLARIPEDQKKRRDDGALFGWHVDARNTLYQERLRLFLREVNAHLTGKRAPVLVDLRGFGRWGEWHSGYPYASLADKRAALQSVLDIWSAAFPQRMLALSYSCDPDGPAEL